MNKIIFKRSYRTLASNHCVLAYIYALQSLQYDFFLVKARENNESDYYWHILLRGDYNRDKLMRSANRINRDLFWYGTSFVNAQLDSIFNSQRGLRLSVINNLSSSNNTLDCTGLPF